MKVRVLSRLPFKIMKVTVENKKGLNKDLKVLIDKKTIETYMEEKYDEIKKTVALKGFRPGKVPKEVLKRQFGKSIYGEVLDKVLKETSTKALEENKIKPAGQPKIDLKSYGEDKDLEYIISITELPKVELKSIENIKIDSYNVKIDLKETELRIKEILNQKFPNKPVSISSEVQPEFREFERFSTTVINAYLQPEVGKYLENLKFSFREENNQTQLSIFQSSGGLADATTRTGL